MDLFPHECCSGEVKIEESGYEFFILTFNHLVPPIKLFRKWIHFCPGCGMALDDF